MQLRTRRALFYSLIVAFLILGTVAVLYSQGWRWDFRDFEATKVGALYIRSFPKDASITLSGDPIDNESWLLKEGTFVESLFPDAYTLEVSAPGYEPWKESLSVLPSLVTERKYIVLVPQLSNATSVTAQAESVTTGSDGTLRYRTATTTVAVGVSVPADRVLDTAQGGRYALTRTGKNVAVRDLERSATYPVTNPTARDERSTLLIDRYDGTRVIVQSADQVLGIDVRTGKELPYAAYRNAKLSSPVAIGERYLAWTIDTVDQNDKRVTMLVVEDKGTPTRAAVTQLVPAPARKVLFVSSSEVAILDTLGSVWFFDVSSRTLTEVAHSVRDVVWTPDDTALAVRGSTYIEIIPRVTERDGAVLRIADADRLVSYSWYSDNQHLILYYPDRVDIIDTHGGAESTQRTIVRSSEAAYVAEDDTFYYVLGSTLYALPFPTQ